ncbi:MAG: hypothetical protein EU516_00200 [Promethearchaeota archaeon]|nr:MAG: hypothetical protein EU516_00200 [Candidatus Lokiarchaeota archaeon]
MVIREAGLLFRGFNLVKKSYHKTTLGKIDSDLRSGLLTALLNFAETAFESDSIEYFEGGKLVIAFINDKIRAEDSVEPELLISYVIMDKEKKIDKHIKKVVKPMLINLAIEFKNKNEMKNLSEVSQFSEFKKDIDAIFRSDSQNVDQKLQGTFY